MYRANSKLAKIVVNKTDAQTANSTLYAPRRELNCRVIREEDLAGWLRMIKSDLDESTRKVSGLGLFEKSMSPFAPRK